MTEDWREMLDGNLTCEILANVADPAALLNARLESVRRSSTAIINSEMEGSFQTLNSRWLSSKEQAETVLEKLQSLGMDVTEIEELQMKNGPFAIEHGDEFRSFLINGMNVQSLIERYAKYPVEVADQMTMDELKALG